MCTTLLRKIEVCAAKQQLEDEKEERIQKGLQAISGPVESWTFKTICAAAHHFNALHYILSHCQQGHTGPHCTAKRITKYLLLHKSGS